MESQARVAVQRGAVDALSSDLACQLTAFRKRCMMRSGTIQRTSSSTSPASARRGTMIEQIGVVGTAWL
jgi:hypothetical protein